jgi:hypothetical protein
MLPQQQRHCRGQVDGMLPQQQRHCADSRVRPYRVTTPTAMAYKGKVTWLLMSHEVLLLQKKKGGGIWHTYSVDSGD